MNIPENKNENSHDPLHSLDILNEMRREGLESSFIGSLMENCQKYEGIKDLMEMWYEESSPYEQSKIIADLQESLEDVIEAPETPEEHPSIDFDKLDTMKQDIKNFKKYLHEEVDRQGGISELARKTGIPQPSLSRFFASNSMPRRTTLFKIAKALNLPETVVGFKWVR